MITKQITTIYRSASSDEKQILWKIFGLPFFKLTIKLKDKLLIPH